MKSPNKFKFLLFSICMLLAFGCQKTDSNLEGAEALKKTSNLTSTNVFGQYSCTIDVTEHGILPSNSGVNNRNNFISLMDSLKNEPNRCPNIVFPTGIYPGVYIMPNGLDGMSIIGAGIDNTIIKMSPDSFGYPGSAGVLTVGGQQTKIKNLTIDGNGTLAHTTGFVPSSGDGYVCLHLSGNGSTADNLKLTNAYNKQSVIAANQVSITNSSFISNYDNCTMPDGSPCVGMDVDGIHVYGETQNYHTININNCSFQGNKRAGVFIEQKITSITIEDNEFIECTDGIKQQGRGTGINIVGNFFNACNRGINSQSGLGIMTIDNNIFQIQERVMLLHGGMKFADNNTNTGLSFTREFNGKTYEKLGHKIEFVNNTVEFVQGPFNTQATNVFDLATYNSGIAAIIPTFESRYNCVEELIIDNNIFSSQNVTTSPDLIRFNTHDFSDGHGFIHKTKILNNRWENGKMGPFQYPSQGGCLAEVFSLQVENNIFKNLQGCQLFGNYVAFQDNEIYNNPYDAAVIRAKNVDIYRNKFYANSNNPTRSKRLVFKRLYNKNIDQGDNYHYLNNSISPMVNWNTFSDPCL